MTIDNDFIREMLYQAGEIAKSHREGIYIREKGRGDYVTEADFAVQDYVKNNLKQRYPDIGFVGEEKMESAGEDRPCAGGCRWILDPIDGTLNYIYNYRLSAISLALCENNEISIGAVYNPFTEEYFFARKGEGAFLNGCRIEVNGAKHLREALVGVGTSPYYKELVDPVFERIVRIQREALDIRRTGSAALDLAYVACGRQDAYFEYRLKPWDYAAGILLVQEAGGVVVPLSGELSFEVPSDVLAACTASLVEEIQAL